MNSQETDARFKTIVETMQEKVRNTCYRYVQSREDADDIAQETFLQMYSSLKCFHEDSDLYTWVFRIAVNKSLDFIRRKKRKKRFAVITSLFTSDGTIKSIEDTSSRNPHEALEKKERTAVLHSALENLPENQRSALILSKYQGFSNKEIAAILQLSLSAVESLMNRGKKNLKKQLAEYFEQHTNTACSKPD